MTNTEDQLELSYKNRAHTDTADANLQQLIKHEENTAPILIDFLSYKLAHRRKFSNGHKQLLAKAVGSQMLKKYKNLTLLDATAGFGVDAYMLASLGFDVHMIERSPVIGALLQDALNRAKSNTDFQNLKLQLTIADAIDYIQSIANSDAIKFDTVCPDIIYIDPMYPERKKTALNKKNMRVLKEIVGNDRDAVELFNIALKHAKKRVVVKRPKIAPRISDAEPDLVFKGKSCRYDVYLIITRNS